MLGKKNLFANSVSFVVSIYAVINSVRALAFFVSGSKNSIYSLGYKFFFCFLNQGCEMRPSCLEPCQCAQMQAKSSQRGTLPKLVVFLSTPCDLRTVRAAEHLTPVVSSYIYLFFLVDYALQNYYFARTGT